MKYTLFQLVLLVAMVINYTARPTDFNLWVVGFLSGTLTISILQAIKDVQ